MNINIEAHSLYSPLLFYFLFSLWLDAEQGAVEILEERKVYLEGLEPLERRRSDKFGLKFQY
jgi:hypothetical protein